MRRLLSLLVWPALALPVSLPAPCACAEDAPPPDSPTANVEKKDDKDIKKDFELSKNKGLKWPLASS